MGGEGKSGDYFAGTFGWTRRIPVPPDHPSAVTTVASWFMHLPGQGLGWDKYLLAVVSLEDIPGQRPPVKRYPEAEFEMLVAVLNPARNPVPDDIETWQVMEPINFVGQFHGITREQAANVARACAAGCVNGLLMAETQVYVQPRDGSAAKMLTIKYFNDQWKASLARTVDHERTGGMHERVN